MSFTKAEELRLIELVRENDRKLFGTGLVANGASLRKEAWEDVTNILNSENSSAKRSVEQVKKKWHNLKSAAKKKNSEVNRSRLITGGGPQAESLTNTEAAIVDFVGDTPSFSGLQGFESDNQPANDSVLRDISDFARENAGNKMFLLSFLSMIILRLYDQISLFHFHKDLNFVLSNLTQAN